MAIETVAPTAPLGPSRQHEQMFVPQSAQERSALHRVLLVAIGQKLRQRYDDDLSEDCPERLTAALRQLAFRDAPRSRASHNDHP